MNDALKPEDQDVLTQFCLHHHHLASTMRMSHHKESDWGACKACFLPDHIAKLKHDHFYGGLPKQFKAIVAYLKASTDEKTYTDYLCVA